MSKAGVGSLSSGSGSSDWDRRRLPAVLPRGGDLRRFGWIAVCYLRRPMVWTLIVPAVFFLVVDIMAGYKRPTWQWAYPQPPTPHLTISSAEMLANVRAAGRQSEVDSILLSAVWYSMHRAPQGAVLRAPPAACRERRHSAGRSILRGIARTAESPSGRVHMLRRGDWL